MKIRSHLRRWHSPSVFTLICLCFLLPFATVTVIGGIVVYIAVVQALNNLEFYGI